MSQGKVAGPAASDLVAAGFAVLSFAVVSPFATLCAFAAFPALWTLAKASDTLDATVAVMLLAADCNPDVILPDADERLLDALPVAPCNFDEEVSAAIGS